MSIHIESLGDGRVNPCCAGWRSARLRWRFSSRAKRSAAAAVRDVIALILRRFISRQA